ncbi:MAG: acyltransferase [Victivallaceae bacterium]|nr:acyltransferase [Victivallaceae bacterium]
MKEYHAKIIDVRHGDNFTVVQPVNIYSCIFGDDCFVGPFTEVQKNVTVGHRTRIQSHCFLCELVAVGDDCFIGHGVMFINDLLKTGAPSYDPQDWKKTTIGNKVSIGSNSTILPVDICDEVVIGAGSVVVKDITVPGTYAGNPAKLIRKKEN